MYRPLILFLLLLTACAGVDDARTPQQKNLNRKAFEILSDPMDDPAFDMDMQELPDDDLDQESAIYESFYKQISISVTENMKMREVLTQMANLAGVNIFIVNDVEGSISFTAKNRPFLDILKDICSGAGLKYSINGNSIKIEYDSPMLKVYNVQFLNIQRDMQSSVSISTDIFANQSVATKNDTNATSFTNVANNGSSSLVEGKTRNNFWNELEEALKTIIGEKEGSYVSVHKQGGLITLYTTQSKHDEVQKYLRLLKDTTESQVLIEAKILEVNLNDEYRSGINWNILRRGGAVIRKEFDNTGLFAAGINRGNLSIMPGLIEKFGAVKTLSNPRITVLNNQSAILKVAKNEVIYVPELQRQYATVADNRSTDFLSTTIHTIPIGLVMSVQPSVDKKNNTILLNLRPTISRIVDHKKVPFFYGTTSRTANNNEENNSASQIQSQEIPVVDVREFDSVLKLNSGQIVVMGGLMEEKSHNARDGLPGLPDVDFLAGSNTKTTDVTELVIFLKATILHKKSKTHHNADKKVYDTFANDPRPLGFKK